MIVGDPSGVPSYAAAPAVRGVDAVVVVLRCCEKSFGCSSLAVAAVWLQHSSWAAAEAIAKAVAAGVAAAVAVAIPVALAVALVVSVLGMMCSSS